ncbi:MAG: DUF456 domain-containing protein [Bacteroidales bacterium]|jgi:uncharacterized protein YqgC (DUF456 family)|nr:DUF456 domain-containing protein [Bacteroidales bacterium]
MFLDIVLVITGSLFILTGLVGCIVPAIPGPPLSYIGLLLLQATDFADFSTRFLVISAVIMIIVTVLDYFIPVWGTKKWGGSRAGMIGAMVGLVAGLFFPPAGIILGPFLGAVAGELITGRETNDALKSGIGSFIGFLVGTGLKLATCIAFTYYFIKELVV